MRMPVTVTAISLLRTGIDHTLNRFSLVSQAAPNPECRQHECPGSGYLPQVVIPDLGRADRHPAAGQARLWRYVQRLAEPTMTGYLWHFVPVIAVAVAFYPAGVMP
jgi:hypothetical protein